MAFQAGIKRGQGTKHASHFRFRFNHKSFFQRQSLQGPQFKFIQLPGRNVRAGKLIHSREMIENISPRFLKTMQTYQLQLLEAKTLLLKHRSSTIRRRSVKPMLQKTKIFTRLNLKTVGKWVGKVCHAADVQFR